MRNLETLAHAPGELRWRLTLVQAIKDLRNEVARMNENSAKQMKEMKANAVGPLRVAQIANKELAENKDFGQIKTDVKRLWNGAMFVVVCIVGGVVGFLIKSALK